MPDNSAKIPALRRSIAVLLLLGLIGLFFVLNFFLFIPRQQAAYNQKIFRLLGETVDNFKAQIENKAAYLNKNRKLPNGGSDNEAKDVSLNINNSRKAEDFYQSFAGLKKKWYPEDNLDVKFKAIEFRYDSIFILLDDKTGRKDSSTVHELLDPTLKNLHSNIFDLLILIKRVKKNENPSGGQKKMGISDSLIYKSGSIASGNILPGDSLFQNSRAPLQFSSINDVTMEGSSYKAFSIPFQIGNNDLMLSGFIPYDVYRSSSSHYSYSAFLTLGSLLVLILMILPFLKVFLLSRKERVSVNDVRMLIVVLVGAPFLGLLAAFTLQYYNYVNDKTDEELAGMEKLVTSGFKQEIRNAISQLEYYDSIVEPGAYLNKLAALDSLSTRINRIEKAVQTVKNSFDTSQPGPDSLKANETWLQGIRRYPRIDTTDLKHLFFYPGIYKNLDDIFWVNSDGNQIVKWFFIHRPVKYLQIPDRDFFKAFKENRAWPYPIGAERGSTGRFFYLQPTISYATNEYSVNIATNSYRDFSTGKPDETKKAILVAMAARMYSVSNPVLPKGYNFCIINNSGTILYHSETERSLQENLLDESNRNFELNNAINRRERVLIPSLYLYDHDVKMLVSPIEGMPYFFAGYFNNREQNLFVFHISAFTFLCVSITLLSLLIFLLLNYLIHFRSSELNFRIHESTWMRPSFEKTVFYQQIMGFELILLVLVFFLIPFVPGKLDFSLHTSLLLPLFVATGYYIIKNEHQYQQKKENGKPVVERPFLLRNSSALLTYLFFISMAFYFIYQLMYTDERKLDTGNIILLSLLVAAVPVLAFFAGHLQKITRWLGEEYMHLYTLAILSSILLVSIIPTIGILNYATVEEKRAQVKGKQFDLAQQIETRRTELNKDLLDARLNTPGTDSLTAINYMQQRKLSDSFGIYLPSDTRITLTKNIPSMKDRPLLPDHDQFYKAITGFLFLPKDHADFFSNNEYHYWLRNKEKDQVSLIYRNLTDPLTPEHLIISTDMHQYAGIGTVFFRNHLGIFILITIIILAFCYYHLIRSITKKIFLLDYFVGREHEAESSWLNKYLHQVDNGLLHKYFPNGITTPLTNAIIREKETEFAFTTQEGAERVLRIQYILLPQFKEIWKDLSEEERFILYDFAIDGFTNHKNVDVLYGLYQKGLIRKGEQHLEPMNFSFRNYLLGKSGTEEISQLRQQLHVTSNWGNIKMVFYVLFLAVMVFLFTTQQDVSNKIIAIVSGMVTIIPMLLRLFDKNLYTAPSGKTEKNV